MSLIRRSIVYQAIDRLGVGDAQQGFCEAHQRHAFGRRQRVFVQERVEAAVAVPFLSNGADEPTCGSRDAVSSGVRCIHRGESVGDYLGFAPAMCGPIAARSCA